MLPTSYGCRKSKLSEVVLGHKSGSIKQLFLKTGQPCLETGHLSLKSTHPKVYISQQEGHWDGTPPLLSQGMSQPITTDRRPGPLHNTLWQPQDICHLLASCLPILREAWQI